MFYKIVALNDLQQEQFQNYQKYWRSQMGYLQLIMGYGNKEQKDLLIEMKFMLNRTVSNMITIEEYKKLEEDMMPKLYIMLASYVEKAENPELLKKAVEVNNEERIPLTVQCN